MPYVQPRKPQQNTYVERYNRLARNEWLDFYILDRIEDVQQMPTDWLWSYWKDHLDIGNGRMTPAQELNMAA